MGDSSVGEWAIQQDRLIGGRVRALVEQVVADPPTWATGIRPRPAPGAGRDRWETAVGVVAAYRDQFRITDSTEPLGAAGVRGQQHRARLTARVAWRRVQHHPQVLDHIPASANDRLRALSWSQHRDPIEAGEALSRLKAAQRSHTRERPHERAGIGVPGRGPSL